MQIGTLSGNSDVHAAASEKAAIEQPAFVHDEHGPSTSARPNMALGGVLLGCPVMVIAFFGLLVAGRPIFEALLVAYGLPLLVFGVVIVVGLARANNAEPAGFASFETDYRSPGTADT